MRKEDKKRFGRVDDRIRKAEESLENVEDLDVPKTLEMQFVDQIPLGQFPKDSQEETREVGRDRGGDIP